MISRADNGGFTLIELLLVVTIIGTLMSVSIPLSYSMYERYKASASAEKVLTYVSKVRLDSFLYGEENTIAARQGRLTLNDKAAEMPDELSFQVENPIKFFRTGATTGGAVKIYVGEHAFVLEIEAPFGALSLQAS